MEVNEGFQIIYGYFPVRIVTEDRNTSFRSVDVGENEQPMTDKGMVVKEGWTGPGRRDTVIEPLGLPTHIFIPSPWKICEW